MHLIQERITAKPAVVRKAPTQPAYPSTGYFQAQFESLHEIIESLQQHISDTNHRMALLQQRLDLLTRAREHDGA